MLWGAARNTLQLAQHRQVEVSPPVRTGRVAPIILVYRRFALLDLLVELPSASTRLQHLGTAAFQASESATRMVSVLKRKRQVAGDGDDTKNVQFLRRRQCNEDRDGIVNAWIGVNDDPAHHYASGYLSRLS
jgi:hypothetical protein